MDAVLRRKQAGGRRHRAPAPRLPLRRGRPLPHDPPQRHPQREEDGREVAEAGAEDPVQHQPRPHARPRVRDEGEVRRGGVARHRGKSREREQDKGIAGGGGRRVHGALGVQEPGSVVHEVGTQREGDRKQVIE